MIFTSFLNMKFQSNLKKNTKVLDHQWKCNMSPYVRWLVGWLVIISYSTMLQSEHLHMIIKLRHYD